MLRPSIVQQPLFVYNNIYQKFMIKIQIIHYLYSQYYHIFIINIY